MLLYMAQQVGKLILEGSLLRDFVLETVVHQ
jgi:hypothetical protein